MFYFFLGLALFIFLFSFGKEKEKSKAKNLKKESLSLSDDDDVLNIKGGHIGFTFYGDEKIIAESVLTAINSQKPFEVNKENSDIFYRIIATLIASNKNPGELLIFFRQLKNFIIDATGGCHDAIAYKILECYILLEDYQSFIEARKGYRQLGNKTQAANTAINVHYQANKEPINTLDLIWLNGSRKSPFIQENPDAFLDSAIKVFSDYAEKNGGWFEIMESFGMLDKNKQIYSGKAFGGYGEEIPFSFDTFCFYSCPEFNNLCKQLQKDAENMAREKAGLPLVGQGWISETELFEKIKKAYPQYRVIQHGSPTWLGRQHLDIWIPEIKVAVEYHGLQHFEPVEFFGGEDAYWDTVERDERKERLCKKNKVKLIVVSEGYDIDYVFDQINERRKLCNV